MEETWRQFLEGVLVHHNKVNRKSKKQQQEGENKMNGVILQGSLQPPLHLYRNRVTQ